MHILGLGFIIASWKNSSSELHLFFILLFSHSHLGNVGIDIVTYYTTDSRPQHSLNAVPSVQ